MVNPLSHLEDLAEGLVEGTFARLLRARLQPIEVARRIARAMEDGQVVGAQGEVIVPNEYRVYLNPDDLQSLSGYRDALREDLARYVVGLARAADATFPGRPRVYLEEDQSLSPRRVRVEAKLRSARHTTTPGHTQTLPTFRPTPAQRTVAGTYALFDGRRRMPVTEAVITIGRSLDNDIILDDRRVSRRHAQMRRQHGQYVLYDLNSTGGTALNGRPIQEAVLRPGDVISFAGVHVRFERIRPGGRQRGATRVLHSRERGRRR